MADQHIAILVSALGAGGAERVVGQLAAHWLAGGRQVSVITFDRTGDPVYHPLADGVRLERLGVAGAGLAGSLCKAGALRRVLRQLEPDLLVSFLTKNNLLAALATAWLPIRWIASERNNPERQGAHPLWNHLLRFAYRRADAIVCQTEAVKRCFPAAVRKRLTVIANPIARHKRPSSGFHHRLAAVGRLEYQKGFDLLIDAFATIAASHPQWRVDIWGAGPDAAKLDRQIGRFGLHDRISLRGTSKEPGGWIGETDLFVLPSRYEGFPNVLGEAMSAGLPVIAARCDFGPEEMIEHARSGLLVESGSVAALASALDVLLEDDVLQRKLARGARDAVERFAPEYVFEQWDELVEQVCTAPSRRSSAGHVPTDPEPIR